MVNTDFTNFGVNKIIIITALIDGYQYNFHPNTILTNNTTFEEYYSPFSLLPYPLPFSLLPSPLRAREKGWGRVGAVKKYPDKHYTDTNSHMFAILMM